ncbi:MAG TPA: DUF6220 domain-containing protein [Thermomicrobiales bacterium]|nr:hypothetical protein [Chloroflexota bacterium]HCG29243.1 hypothetical protein [Chloroflexota bacterium]HQX61972.1 DUF6220 domain-containing protein [Thermomicrobiales bacterium]HQZ89401.1 DUF6220 domain-containing protein [Thermomicrobiales bacterium]HRA30543.1 DUF6220 domain-containing protein [Thermomicrobiales bacterium]
MISPAHPISRWSRIGFVVSAWLYAVGVIIQVFLAGLSVFNDATRWPDHVQFGQMVGGFTVLMVAFAVVGRLPWLIVGLAFAEFMLYGMQYPFALSSIGAMAALHAVNALIMFWLAITLAQRTQSLALSRATA